MTEATMNFPPKGDTDPSPVYERLVGLLESDDATYAAGKDDFLQARLRELSETSSQRSINGLVGTHVGFVGPDSEIYPQALGIGYRLDDTEPYRIGLDEMRTYYAPYRKKMTPEKAVLNASLMAAQQAEVKYFGNVASDAKGAAEREDLLADVIDEDTPPYRSIAEFKGRAMCAERAFVCNNILQVLGVQPVVELGSLKTDDTHEELHAYLLVEASDGSIRIFDPQNPTLSTDKDGNLTHISFTTYLADSLVGRTGEQVKELKVMRKAIQTDQQGQKVTTEKPYIYKLGIRARDLGYAPLA
jgi:hypothetical protein